MKKSLKQVKYPCFRDFYMYEWLLKLAQETFPVHNVADVSTFSHQPFAVGCTNFEG